MFQRLRQMRISLAAKCQILFGTAVAAIIFAELFVPWQRMEQLTEQLNEKAASAVADSVVVEHIARMSARAGRLRVLEPEPPTTDPAAAGADAQPFPAPRMLPLAALKTPEKLTRFERASLLRFAQDPTRRGHRRSS